MRASAAAAETIFGGRAKARAEARGGEEAAVPADSGCGIDLGEPLLGGAGVGVGGAKPIDAFDALAASSSAPLLLAPAHSVPHASRTARRLATARPPNPRVPPTRLTAPAAAALAAESAV